MNDQFSKKPKVLPEVAFYYPNQYIHNPDWVKNLILFFDGIGMLIPNYMSEHSRLDDLALITGLKEHGLFHVIEPETVVDKDATRELVSRLKDIIDSGVLNELNNEPSAFGSISMSRMGFYGDPELAQEILEELKSRGLAKDTEDGGHSIPIHRTIRSLILVLLAHILRPQGEKQGLDLSPATDRPGMVQALGELVSVSSISTTPMLNDIIAFDMNTVGVDLGSAPVDEVLAFRKEHYSEHRNYTLCVRKFVHELSHMEYRERVQAFEARQEELESIASDLRKLARRAWQKPASFALSLTSVVLSTGNPFASVFTAAGALVGYDRGRNKVETGVYSYLFSARSRYP